MVFLYVVVLITTAFAFKLTYEINRIKFENTTVQNHNKCSINKDSSKYTSFKAQNKPLEPTLSELSEPSEIEYEDVVERIKMLRSHLEYQPSPQWINNVITAAELEIKYLRNQ